MVYKILRHLLEKRRQMLSLSSLPGMASNITGKKEREMTRKEEDDYFGDVVYQVWKWGGNPDLVEQERTDEYFYDGFDVDTAARAERLRQRKKED